jgi:cytochrome c biogenesis protein CcdA
MEQILGILLSIISLGVVFVAFPTQIYKNWKNKNFGISLTLILFGIAIYLIRIPYTFLRSDYYILIPDIVGLLIHLILIYQYFLYRKK